MTISYIAKKHHGQLVHKKTFKIVKIVHSRVWLNMVPQTDRETGWLTDRWIGLMKRSSLFPGV